MKTIRHNTFETNSSSTHSLLILTEEENNKIDNGELFIESKYEETLITKEEADKIFLEAIEEYNSAYPEDKIHTIEEFKETDWYLDNISEYPCNVEEWAEEGSLDYDVTNYVSPSGNKIIIHALYGYNG